MKKKEHLFIFSSGFHFGHDTNYISHIRYLTNYDGNKI